MSNPPSLSSFIVISSLLFICQSLSPLLFCHSSLSILNTKLPFLFFFFRNALHQEKTQNNHLLSSFSTLIFLSLKNIKPASLSKIIHRTGPSIPPVVIPAPHHLHQPLPPPSPHLHRSPNQNPPSSPSFRSHPPQPHPPSFLSFLHPRNSFIDVIDDTSTRVLKAMIF
ncbi:hypothetical protein HanIR_Chr10g0489781 [Helianthus annuus]|nr:hypothetical protein HanIR_Chr10g0489781 [Helianthus annuus]